MLTVLTFWRVAQKKADFFRHSSSMASCKSALKTRFFLLWTLNALPVFVCVCVCGGCVPLVCVRACARARACVCVSLSVCLSICLLGVMRKTSQVKVKNLFQKLQMSSKCSIFVYVFSRILLCSLFCICLIVADQTVFVLCASGSR